MYKFGVKFVKNKFRLTPALPRGQAELSFKCKFKLQNVLVHRADLFSSQARNLVHRLKLAPKTFGSQGET